MSCSAWVDPFGNGDRHPCKIRASGTRWGLRVCATHLRTTHVYLSPTGKSMTDGLWIVYAMATDEIVKIGRSVNPYKRLGQVNTTDFDRSYSLDGLAVVATRYEWGREFTEASVHKALGYRDRIGKEWWLLTERTRIILALCGLTWEMAADVRTAA